MIATTVERIAISKVEVGVRRREKLGNLRSLSKSIEARGLLHPILIRNGRELIAGQRRLEACRALGWSTIPARDVTGCDDDELRAIELEENVERLDLADYEANKARFAWIRQTEADLKAAAAAAAAAETRKQGAQVSRTGGARGPARTPGSLRDVAAVTGISPAGQRNITKHVETAERYPFMQQAGWNQHNVTAAAERIEAIPERERPKIATILDQPGIAPTKAIKMIENMATKPPAERAEIYKLAQSDDRHVRMTAATRALAAPPPVDPGLFLFCQTEAVLRDAARSCRVARFKPRLAAFADGAGKLKRAIEAYQTKLREDAE